MNNFKKVGLTALAGSLVAFSAHAGELTVTGGANATYKWGKDATANHGNTSKGIGTDKDVAFTGSGELDNGTTFSVGTATVDSQTGLTSGYITITTPSFGSFLMGHSTGGVAGKYDEEVPQVYEQLSDVSSMVSANKVGDFMDNNHINYTSPALEFAGVGVSIDLGYSPQARDSVVGDGGTGGGDGTYGAGKEAGVTLSYEGLKAGFYGAERENITPTGTGDKVHDEFNGAWYVKYNFGPVSIGYSESYLDSGLAATSTTALATTTAKTLRSGASDGFFEGEQIGIAFNVNENFSVSYSESEETYDEQSDLASGDTADVSMKMDAMQVAYSMGGMSIKAYKMKIENPFFDEDAEDTNITEIALGLAF